MNAFVDFWHLCLEPWKEAVKYQIGSFGALAEFCFDVCCFFKPPTKLVDPEKGSQFFFLHGFFFLKQASSVCWVRILFVFTPKHGEMIQFDEWVSSTTTWSFMRGNLFVSEWIIFFGRQAGKTNHQRRAFFFPTNPLWWFQICCVFTQKHGEMMQLDLHIFCKWVGSTTDHCTI